MWYLFYRKLLFLDNLSFENIRTSIRFFLVKSYKTMYDIDR